VWRDQGVIESAAILQAKVLIVDDLPADVLLLEHVLVGAGYVSVTSTSDPLAVCELHRTNRYDLILLDIQMATMDGYTVMAGLEEIEEDGTPLVLALSSQPDHRRRALRVGAAGFVSKPFDLADLLTRIHDLLAIRLFARAFEKTVGRGRASGRSAG
jgi:adenylate cyclase